MAKPTYDLIIEAQTALVEYWGESGKRVIEECAAATPFNDKVKKFFEHCTCCGGNWGGMLLSGIKELWPNVWEAIPDEMGLFAWPALCYTLTLCGVDSSEE